MTIQFKIPNGTMAIEAEVFFQEARITKIRKMLKMYQVSSPKPEDVLTLREWLTDQAAAENQAAKDAAGDHINERSRLAELEDQYERMKSPCYTVYTQNKEALQEAKQQIIDCRRQCRTFLRQYNDAVKTEARYKDVLKEFSKIFGLLI